MQDEEIVALFLQRDETAIRKSEEKYARYCRSIAGNILACESDVEEALNDTWMWAWNSIPPHKPENLGTYLGKLTRRSALKKRRDTNTQKRGGGELPLVLDELEEVISTAKNVDEELVAQELSAALDVFVRNLEDMQRRVFLRRYYYLQSIDEICFATGFKPGKIHSMLHRIRNKLRIYLKKEDLL